MSTVITRRVALAIQAQDSLRAAALGIDEQAAEDLARAAIAAYGDALAEAGLAIVPLTTVKALQARAGRSLERTGQDGAGREVVRARLSLYRSLGSRKA